jgi:AraC-like DNA-binding protein
MNRDLLKENRIHGDPLYPLSIYQLHYAANSSMLDCHWHDEMEFFLVTEGKTLFQIDTVYHEVYAGQVIFINSGELHACYPLDDAPCSFCAVVFRSDMLCSSRYDVLQEKFIDPLVKKQYVLPDQIKPDTEWGKEVLLQLAEIIQLNTLKPYSFELSTKARIYLILSTIYSHCPSLPLSRNYEENNYKVERLKQVLNYIHTNYQERIRLKDLAAQVSMSEGHFCRIFKEMMKKTPVDYINYFRTQKAAKLLEKNNKKIFEIAMDVGFDNLSYFIGIFKQYMMCTPSIYRKNYHEGLKTASVNFPP